MWEIFFVKIFLEFLPGFGENNGRNYTNIELYFNIQPAHKQRYNLIALKRLPILFGYNSYKHSKINTIYGLKKPLNVIS